MKPLKNITTRDGSDLDRIDPRTVSERYNNSKTAYWIGHTQVWQFPEGDAIAVVTNHCGEPCSAAIIIRVADKVCTFTDPGGVVGAMRLMGLDPQNYQVQ